MVGPAAFSPSIDRMRLNGLNPVGSFAAVGCCTVQYSTRYRAAAIARRRSSTRLNPL